jgi:hypothetical protein
MSAVWHATLGWLWIAHRREPEEREHHTGWRYRLARLVCGLWPVSGPPPGDDLWGVGGVQFREGRPNPPRPTRVWR